MPQKKNVQRWKGAAAFALNVQSARSQQPLNPVMYILRMAAVYSQGYRAVGVLDRGCECEHHHRRRETRVHTRHNRQRERRGGRRRRRRRRRKRVTRPLSGRDSTQSTSTYFRLPCNRCNTEFRWSQDNNGFFKRIQKKAVENLKLQSGNLKLHPPKIRWEYPVATGNKIHTRRC